MLLTIASNDMYALSGSTKISITPRIMLAANELIVGSKFLWYLFPSFLKIILFMMSIIVGIITAIIANIKNIFIFTFLNIFITTAIIISNIIEIGSIALIKLSNILYFDKKFSGFSFFISFLSIICFFIHEYI